VPELPPQALQQPLRVRELAAIVLTVVVGRRSLHRLAHLGDGASLMARYASTPFFRREEECPRANESCGPFKLWVTFVSSGTVLHTASRRGRFCESGDRGTIGDRRLPRNATYLV
jgi:hypothetical protein